ncbi:MAG: N-acetylmuramoyl-L-alanine amidase [Deltaproteobacteria bacterium]|nr:N-acetylmuramoyl-L-alanine amidase [Deltaproteobacteria bacterium]
MIRTIAAILAAITFACAAPIHAGNVPGTVRTIVIDPGHGGDDVGAVGPGGTKEKLVTLKVASALKDEIERAMPGVKVVLTRTNDSTLTLEDRTNLANEKRADIFISIHANAAKRKDASGVETFFLSLDSSDDDARMTAAYENNVLSVDENKYGDDTDNLKSILWDMVQAEAHKESSLLAEIIQARVVDTLGSGNRGIKQAPFHVLFGATMPAILVEVGFISNPKEEKLLSDRDHIAKIALALASGITDFDEELTKRISTARRTSAKTKD